MVAYLAGQQVAMMAVSLVVWMVVQSEFLKAEKSAVQREFLMVVEKGCEWVAAMVVSMDGEMVAKWDDWLVGEMDVPQDAS